MLIKNKRAFKTLLNEHHIYHKSHFGMLSLPLSFYTQNKVFDLAIAGLIPIHSHISMKNVIADYVPKISTKLLKPANNILTGLTIISITGMMKININGIGMSTYLKEIFFHKN